MDGEENLLPIQVVWKNMTISLNQKITEKLQDPKFAQEYDDLELQSQLAEQVITLRQKRGLTQTQLANLIGTRQSSISRLENMNELPSLSFLVRIADILGVKIDVKFIDESS